MPILALVLLILCVVPANAVAGSKTVEVRDGRGHKVETIKRRPGGRVDVYDARGHKVRTYKER